MTSWRYSFIIHRPYQRRPAPLEPAAPPIPEKPSDSSQPPVVISEESAGENVTEDKAESQGDEMKKRWFREEMRQSPV